MIFTLCGKHNQTFVIVNGMALAVKEHVNVKLLMNHWEMVVRYVRQITIKAFWEIFRVLNAMAAQITTILMLVIVIIQ